MLLASNFCASIKKKNFQKSLPKSKKKERSQNKTQQDEQTDNCLFIWALVKSDGYERMQWGAAPDPASVFQKLFPYGINLKTNKNTNKEAEEETDQPTCLLSIGSVAL